ncbi:uncharacterized protein LOC135387789 [Ornithodoros turicata]|uniref:uncharacterized protein LOC135387789 n=1 Tax=Ornithodoros turicata TaxID=34597 RepID=UPI003139F3EC
MAARRRSVLLLIGLLLCLTDLANSQLIKLPRLSGRLRLPFFRKPGKEPAGSQQNVEADLTQFLQNGASPNGPTLHKLLLKQYNGPPLQSPPGFPRPFPFGMPRLPPPYYPFPIPGRLPPPPGSFGPKPLGTTPPYVGVPPPPPRPPQFSGPPRPPKGGPHKAPPIVFGEKDQRGSASYDHSGEVDDDVPIVIRGRKHPKRRRPIVIEDIDSDEDDNRPVILRGRKPYRTQRPLDEDDEDEDLFDNRRRPITLVQELSDSRPYRGRPSFEDHFPSKPQSYGSDRFIPPTRSSFFQPDSSKYDHIMASEQTNHEHASSPPFFSGVPPSVMEQVNRIMSSRHHHMNSASLGESGAQIFFNEPKVVISPHLDSPPPVRQRFEAPVIEQKEGLPPEKPLLFHLSNKATNLLQDKYVQALIVPLQSNLDAVGANRALYNPSEEVTLPQGVNDVKEKEDQEGSSKQTPMAAHTFPPATYITPPGYMNRGDNGIQTLEEQSNAQPTAIRILVRNPVDGSSREVFSTAFKPEKQQEGGGNKVVIIAIPKDENEQMPNSRSSSVANTYFQSTSPNNAGGASKLQNLAPKVPHTVSLPSKYQYDAPLGNGITFSQTTQPYSTQITPSKTDPSSTYFGVPQMFPHSPPKEASRHEVNQQPVYNDPQVYNAQKASTGSKIQVTAPAVQQYTAQHPSYSAGQEDRTSLVALPMTTFTCQNKVPGFYADTQHKCQVYHQCNSDSTAQSFLCPNGTAFNQQSLACEWWYRCPQYDSTSSASGVGTNPVRSQSSYTTSVSYSVGGSSHQISAPPSVSTYATVLKQTSKYKVPTESLRLNKTSPTGGFKARRPTQLQGTTRQRRLRKPATSTTTVVPLLTST